MKELARSTEVPVELPAMLVLATVAAITQSIFEVEVREDYWEPTNLWVLAVLPPASRKSKIYTEVTAPLRNWATAVAQIPWGHNIILMQKVKALDARLWYAAQTIRERLEPEHAHYLDRNRFVWSPRQSDSQLSEYTSSTSV